MDLGYTTDRPYRPIPADLMEVAGRIAAFLAGGGRAVVITGPARSGKRALLDGLLAGMAGRLTRIDNRTGSPLVLDGMLRQMGKVVEDEADERGLFFRTMADQAYDDYSAVLAVEDAHTLSSLALGALARVPGLGGPDLPGMILVLAGEGSLLEKLDLPGLDSLRNPRRTLLVSLPGADPCVWPDAVAAVGPVPAIAQAGGQKRVSEGMIGWARGILGMRAVVLAMAAGAVAAGAGLTWSALDPGAAEFPATVAQLTAAPFTAAPLATVPGAVATAVEPQASAVVASPMPSVSVVPAPVVVEEDPVAREAAPMERVVAGSDQVLRREFDAFLNRAGRDTAKLTPAARETLFREYLAWRARTAAETRAP